MPRSEMMGLLLVEDNPRDAELIQRVLAMHKLANQLDWVQDGAKALDFMFRRGQYIDRPDTLPRLVLLDLRLPKVDGLEVLQQLRAEPTTRDVPVVILTSSKEERDLLSSYEFGVNSFVSKPIAFDEFAKTVAELGMYWLLVNRTRPEDRYVP